jgi:MFS transporter, ACS family, hexuronate transporter
MSTASLVYRRRPLIVATFALALSVTAIDRNLLAAVWPAIQVQLRLTNGQYGTLVAGFSLAYGLFAPLMGFLLDRFGLTRVTITAIAIWSLCGIATAFASGFWVLLLCRVLLGCAESAALPSAGKAYATYLLPAERSLGTAASQVALTLGSVAATLLAGAMVLKFGWQSTFLIAGPLGLLWIPVWLGVSAKYPANSMVEASERTAISTGSLFRRRELWALTMTNLLVMPLYSLWTNWTTVYLVRERGLSATAANLHFAWIPPILATLGGAWGGWLAMRGVRKGRSVQKARFVVCLWAALALLITSAIPILPSVQWATAGIGLSFFCTLCISVNVYAMALDLFGTGHAALVFSLLTAIYGLMQTAISPLIGYWIDRHSFTAVCILAAITPICGVGVLYWSIFRSNRTQRMELLPM